MILDELTQTRPVRAAATLMADAIRQVHEKYPDAWVLTDQKHMLALNVGHVQVMNLFEDECAMCILKGRRALPSTLRVSTSFDGYESIPTPTQYLYVDYEDFDTVPGTVRDAFLALAHLAAEKVSPSPYRRHHAPHAVEWLRRLTGVHIPQPAYIEGTTTSRREDPLRVGAVSENTYLVLVENEVTAGGAYDDWDDQTGVLYHYPNTYRNRIQSGAHFIYYRGVRRRTGRAPSGEYFGTGIIGDIWQDPNVPASTPASKRKWYCTIEEYEAFPAPVPAHRDGVYFEAISHTKGWRTGVRQITDTVFFAIMGAAGIATGTSLNTNKPIATDSEPALEIVGELDKLFLALPKNRQKGQAAQRRGGRDTKATGDAAEALVVAWLRQSLPPDVQDTVHWVAQANMTPGWDIEHTTTAGVRHVYEVKGTVRHAFASIDISANEWRAAQRERALYHLVLVTSVLSSNPRIAIIDDPYGCWERNELTAEATAFRLIRETDEAATNTSA